MKVHAVIQWSGHSFQEGQFANPGPYEVSMEDLASLFERFDVGFIHSYGPAPTRKEAQAGVKQTEETVIILDRKGGHFHQR